ncbi:RNA polymerase factor sigma-54 [Pelomicrobium methylotrophicum]|uniref:RNA polymerase sigma-54 factor n=1 Tax=Pelomicrobium methylotrophicum TaxID=2602750 RepID=A0A5C7EWZ7_9PROT|nr:RNA polymerase factor sigma-54 [Pelomicrobium methylotrophicum]TXF12870.1 RNA polymerase factor sigma-54 [Pelomicrobium methylotrophicum]
MKPSLQLKLTQHLALTPQLQQSIRLLQLSTLELNQEVERILQENPLLECEEDEESLPPFPSDRSALPLESFDAAAQRATPETVEAPLAPDTGWLEDEGSYHGPRDDGEDPGYPQLAAMQPTLRDHLNWQLTLTQLSERDRKLTQLLIDALDDDGYLTQDLDELLALLPPELGVERDELVIALKHLQNLDPPGVGARNLKECLLLQLKALPEDTPYVKQALAVVENHLEALAARDYNKLKRALGCDEQCLKQVQMLITRLNPRPGSDFAQVEARYVVPDVIVKKVKGAWVASLNPEAMPRLRINRMYADILSRNRDASHQQLTAQLQEAKWLIKNVQQRFDTILRVAQAIVDRQRHFFEHGEVAMRPLVLREIAETLGLHESTVSRVTSQKYMLTPRGTFELKYFFGSHVQTEAGGACSATAIRALIKQLVSAEDSRRPLSDSQISEILGQQGIMVARRTVAKYRESLQILPANLRKSL